jgi:hypothetical protein
MHDNVYKILTNSADYMCLSCGTYNCNSGICDRCGSIQFGSPAYARRVQIDKQHEEEQRLIKEHGGYTAYLEKQERDRKFAEQRTAGLLRQRERHEQAERDRETAYARELNAHALELLPTMKAPVAAGSVGMLIAVSGDFGAFAGFAIFAMFALFGCALARPAWKTWSASRPVPEEPAYTRAPRSK